MVVQHNLRAMNSNRMLGLTASVQSKSTEKLSSGYKINRAADDAAGLSISEKMRKQIRGLSQASLNAADGISAVQTAEGALNEVQDMLQRMNELSVKASNGTMSEDDRSYIQNEIDQLVTEIDRVAETTKFNEAYVLKGDDAKPQIENEVFATPNMTLVEAAMAEGSVLEVKTEMDADGKTIYKFATGLVEGGTWNGKTIVDADAGANEITLDAAKAAELEAMNAVIETYASEMGIEAGTVLEEGEANEVQSTSKEFTYNAALDLSLHVGADSASNNKIDLSIESMSADRLGVKGLKVDGKSSLQATSAIDVIADAVQMVSEQRSALGAVQNRLEHTIANLDNVFENTTAAESQIRDTDMATEMVKYSNNNILAQAGQAMLAQANQANQGVLSLLG